LTEHLNQKKRERERGIKKGGFSAGTRSRQGGFLKPQTPRPGHTGRERRGRATGCCRHVGHWSAAVASRRPFHAVTFATVKERESLSGRVRGKGFDERDHAGDRRSPDAGDHLCTVVA